MKSHTPPNAEAPGGKLLVFPANRSAL